MTSKKPTAFLKWKKDAPFWRCETHNIMILKIEEDPGYHGVSKDGEESFFYEDTLREAKLAAEKHVIKNLKIQLKRAQKLQLI